MIDHFGAILAALRYLRTLDSCGGEELRLRSFGYSRHRRERHAVSKRTGAGWQGTFVATLAALLFAPTIAAQTLSGGTTELHEGGFLSAAGPVLSEATGGTIRLERGTLGELAAGLSTGFGLRLRGGVLHAISPDTDGDGTPDVSDDDDDGDGLLDTDEAFWGTLPLVADTDGDGLSDGDEVNVLGTNPTNSDSDGDGLLDGADLSPLDYADCRARNPQLKLVWGRDAPFGVDHQNDPGVGHRYLMNNAGSLPGLSSEDPRLPPGLAESLRAGLQNLFDDARADYPLLPDTTNGLQIATLTDADPLPAQGAPGSPSLLYVIDRSVLEDPVTDPDFGPLEGLAWTGVNRFNKRCTGEVGSVILDPDALPLPTDLDYPDHLANLVETAAHEAGHLYGLRHVLPDGLGACVGEEPGATPAVMDYFPDGSATRLAHCTATPGQGCSVTEPPTCFGKGTGEDHNPLYHYLHFVVGDSTDDLAAAGIVPGAWDADSAPLVTWQVEFNFIGSGTTDPNHIFYNFTLIEVLPNDVEKVRAVFSEITLGEINGDPGALPEPIPGLTIQFAQSSGLTFSASSIPPSVSNPDPFQDYLLEEPVYPPASQPPPSGTLISSQVLQLDETDPEGPFTAAFEATGAPTPRYLIRSGGLEDPPDGVYELPAGGSAEVQLTSSTYTCTDCFPAMRVTHVAESAAAQQVPEPGFGAGLAAGLAALLAARKRRERWKAGGSAHP